MIGNQLITQVFVAGLSIGIVLTYIKPTLDDISTHQDAIAQTKQQLATIAEANAMLTEKVNQVNAIPQNDKAALSAYLPETLDPVRVLRDLTRITDTAEILVTGLSYEGDTTIKLPEGSPRKESDLPVAHIFALEVSSSYEELKRLLVLLEKNNYPLDIYTLSLSPQESGSIDTSFEIITYSHK